MTHPIPPSRTYAIYDPYTTDLCGRYDSDAVTTLSGWPSVESGCVDTVAGGMAMQLPTRTADNRVIHLQTNTYQAGRKPEYMQGLLWCSYTTTVQLYYYYCMVSRPNHGDMQCMQ